MKVATSLLQIGEVAERVGLSLRTVRYYEEMGLLVPEKRTDGGFRMYSDDQLDRLGLIKRMKPLGFTVQEMRELLDARDILRDADAVPEARDVARGVLAQFAKAAADRVEQLRNQVGEAEIFADQVRRESRGVRHSRTLGPKP